MSGTVICRLLCMLVVILGIWTELAGAACSVSCCSSCASPKSSSVLWPLQAGSARLTKLKAQLAPKFQANGYANCIEKCNQLDDDAFSFYRGTNAMFFYDMNSSTATGVQKSTVYDSSTSAATWLCGDLHYANLGTFAKATVSTYDIIFDVTDFDESARASYLYDLFRVAASFAIVSLDLNGKSTDNTIVTIQELAQEYYQQLGKFHSGGGCPSSCGTYCDEDSFSWSKSDASGYSSSSNPVYDVLNSATQGTAAARRKSMLDDYSIKVNGVRQFDFTSVPKAGDLLDIDSTTYTSISNAWSSYYSSITDSKLCVGSSPCLFSTSQARADYFAIQDIAKRINAGLGSLGVERFYVIIEGMTSDADDDRILDVKFQGLPTANISGGLTLSSAYDQSAEQDDRVVYANKQLIYQADDHLGTIQISLAGVVKYFSVRERAPEKDALPTTGLTNTQLKNAAHQFGIILAGGHAKTDGSGSNTFQDAVYDKICTTMGEANFMTEVANFAVAYRSQVQTDYALFAADYAANPSNWCGSAGRRALSTTRSLRL